MEPKSKTKVWLISTRDVTSLFDGSNSKTILFDSGNSAQHDIKDAKCLNNIEPKKMQVTLSDFYNDFLQKNPFYYNYEAIRTILDVNAVQTKIHELLKKNNTETTAIYFDKVFQLKNKNIFLTRCFPEHLDTATQKSVDIGANHYWLICYMQTVANILQLKIEEIEFYGILHSGDISGAENRTLMIERELSMRNDDGSTHTENTTFTITPYTYSHDVGNLIYTDVISNNNFFANLLNDEKIDVEAYIELNMKSFGIFERIGLLKNIGLTSIDAESEKFCLGSKVKKSEFKNITGKELDDYLK